MNIKKLFVLSLLLAAGIFLKGESAFAATKTWVGAGADNNFNTSANWNPSGAPSNGDDLVFDTGTAVTRNEPVNNMAGLSVKSITFIGSGLAGVVEVKATTPLTITESVSDSSTVTTVTHITGDVILGGDVISKGVAYDDATGSIDLNGNSILFQDALGEPFIISMDSPITGSGTVTFNAPNTDFQLNTANTYSGGTVFYAGTILNVGLLPNELFGTSDIVIAPAAALYIPLTDAANNTTWNNNILIEATDKSNWVNDFASLTFNSLSGSTLNIAVPHITLASDSRMYSSHVVVNLAGITSNGHCVEYVNYSPTSGTWFDTGQFVNGPAYCVVASVTTKPKVPDTGFGLLLNNPTVTAGGTAIAAAMLFVISRRLKPAARRSRR